MSSRSVSPHEGENVTQTMTKFRQWFVKKRKRNSPYPSPSPSPSPSASPSLRPIGSKPTTKSTYSIKKWRRDDDHSEPLPGYQSGFSRLPSPAHDTATGVLQHEAQSARHEPSNKITNLGPVSSRIIATPGRRRSSAAQQREILPPKRFTASDLRRPQILSRPSPCQAKNGKVSQTLVQTGWQVLTWSSGRDFCCTSRLPLYSPHLHSPLRTGKPYTVYFEGEIQPGHSEDAICLALGFVAGDDRVSRMPGFERGSIGMQCRDGSFYVGNGRIKNASARAFRPGDQIGFGMTFSNSGSGVLSASSSSIDVELFATRDGKRIGSWALKDLVEHPDSLRGFDGHNDLYAAVGTTREVDAHIWFDRKYWRYSPPTDGEHEI